MRATFALCKTGVANGGDFLAMGEGTRKVGWRQLAVDFKVLDHLKPNQALVQYDRVFDIGLNREIEFEDFAPHVQAQIDTYLRRYHGGAIAYRAKLEKDPAE